MPSTCTSVDCAIETSSAALSANVLRSIRTCLEATTATAKAFSGVPPFPSNRLSRRTTRSASSVKNPYSPWTLFSDPERRKAQRSTVTSRPLVFSATTRLPSKTVSTIVRPVPRWNRPRWLPRNAQRSIRTGTPGSAWIVSAVSPKPANSIPRRVSGRPPGRLR